MLQKTILPAVRLLLALTLLTGLIYPLVITGAAQLLFNRQANGSLTGIDSIDFGSALIGQPMADPAYFWPRPSAGDYAALPSAASNLSPTSAELQAAVDARAEAFRAAHGLSEDTPVPPDMLFASGSGLDPHISPEAAHLQIERVAEARGLPVEEVAALVETYTEPPQLGFLGQPRVNVLALNLALFERTSQ